jgi:2-polyprenyl-3-methyl-5-hydroxy-6-metoxy-1,4-benzoquinol methylase
MSDERTNISLHDEVREIWNTNAVFWDDKMREGNDFHRLLVGPATERLLNLQPGETVLEIACGNGQLARRLAELGATVLATDQSEQFIERARARTAERPEIAGRLEFRVVDATDEAALLALGEGRFDAIVCGMAIMDMVEIDPMLRAAARLLKLDGRFVFTLTHPCFNHSAIRFTLEEEDVGGELVVTRSIKMLKYRGVGTTKGLGILGQPLPHYYFERTLAELFGACFAAGFVVDGLEEPAFEPGSAVADHVFSWVHFPEIPPVLAARLRHSPSRRDA